MPTIVEMPRLSDTMEEGTLAEWLVEVGAKVSAGDAFADIETDKAVMTFESFDDGVLLHTLIGPGDTVPLGTPMAVLGKAGEDVSALVAKLKAQVEAALAGGGEAPAKSASEPATAAPEPEAAPTPAVTETPPTPSAAAQPAQAPHAPEAPVDGDGVRVKASPLARRIAGQRGIDLTAVAGTGPQGRIVKADLEGLDATRRVRGGRVGAVAIARDDEIIRVSQMRKTIAKRLVESKQQAPHYYLTITVDAGRLVALRKELNASQDRLKISYNDLIMRGCVVALQDHPDVNAAWEGATIRRYAGVHLGFAVALAQGGLITPVVRDADQLGIIALGEQIREMAGRARDLRLDTHEYTGGSFTVSNLGMMGIEHFTAVVNPPAACILAVGALRKEPVVQGDALAIGHRMTLTMSCDHRAVDGAVGAAFLQTLQRVLETPLNLLLD